MNLKQTVKQTHQLFAEMKKQARHDVIAKPYWTLYSDSIARWLLLWCMSIVFTIATANNQIQYAPIAGIFLLAMLFANCVNQIQLNLIKKSYPGYDFKGVALSNLLTHFFILFIILIFSLTILIGTSLLYFTQWPYDWCLITGFSLMVVIDFIIVNFYRFAPYESIFHLAGTFEALRRSRRFVFKHWKQILWLDLTFIGYDIGNFISFGFVELYYHNYKTSVMIRYFKHYHHIN